MSWGTGLHSPGDGLSTGTGAFLSIYIQVATEQLGLWTILWTLGQRICLLYGESTFVWDVGVPQIATLVGGLEHV